MQLTMDLLRIGHNISSGLPNFNQNKPSNAYVPMAGCILDHILSAKNLSDLEKLYYILANSLSSINLYGGGNRAIGLSAMSWAKRLDCAKSKVFAMQRSLEDKGYFILSKDKDRYGHNKRNLICPTLPDDVFHRLSQDSKGRGDDNGLTYNPLYESKLQFLDRIKLFIILGYQVLKNISACPYLTSFHKIVWLDFYTICYKARVGNLGAILIDDDSLDFSFVTSYKQLEDKYSCTKSLLSKTLIDLQELGLIKREQFYTKKEQGDQERQDKSLWKISLISSSVSDAIPSDGGNGCGGGRNSPSQFNGSSFLPFNSNSQGLFSKLYGNKVNDKFDKFGNKSSSVSTQSLDEKQSKDILNLHHCKLLPISKGCNDFENFICSNSDPDPDSDSTDTADGFDCSSYSDRCSSGDIHSCHSSYSYPDNHGSTVSEPEARGEPDTDAESINNKEIPTFESKTSFLQTTTWSNISYHDPEVTNFNPYNNTNINKHIYKSNNVYVNKTNNTENNNHKTFITQSTTQNAETIKNGWQNIEGSYDTARTDFKGVFKGKIFLKEKIRKISKFSVSGLLIKEKLKLLSRDKANKARKFAYSLFSKEIVKGYASTVSKHELAKQFIFHATSWRPTKIARGAGEEELVDVALSVAWNAVVSGDWKEPLEWAKAKALQYEFLDYKRKYRDSGIISHELGSLETMINNFLGTSYNLSAIIAAEVKQEIEAEEARTGEVGVGRTCGNVAHVEALDRLKLEVIKGCTVSNIGFSGERKTVLRNFINKSGNWSSGNPVNYQGLLYHCEEVNTVNIVNNNTGDGIALPLPVTNYNYSNNGKYTMVDEELKCSVLELSHSIKVQQKEYINKSFQYTRGEATFCCKSMIQSKKFCLTKYDGGAQYYGYDIHKSLWRTELDLYVSSSTHNVSSGNTCITKGDTHASNMTKDFTKIDKTLNDILKKIMTKN